MRLTTSTVSNKTVNQKVFAQTAKRMLAEKTYVSGTYNQTVSVKIKSHQIKIIYDDGLKNHAAQETINIEITTLIKINRIAFNSFPHENKRGSFRRKKDKI